jgi:hypothetical protein
MYILCLKNSLIGDNDKTEDEILATVLAQSEKEYHDKINRNNENKNKRCIIN